MEQITGTIGVYLTSPVTKHEIDSLRANVRSGDAEKVIKGVAITAAKMEDYGWVKVGIATVTIDFIDDNDIMKPVIESLRLEKQKILAEAQRQATNIEEQIQQLLAIEHVPNTAPADHEDPNIIPF